MRKSTQPTRHYRNGQNENEWNFYYKTIHCIILSYLLAKSMFFLMNEDDPVDSNRLRLGFLHNLGL